MASAPSRRAFAVPAVAALSLAWFLIGFDWPFMIYDEGVAVYGAARILRGDVPYRDFWLVYPPGQSYLLAGLFSLLGTTLIVERVLTTLVLTTLAVLVYVTACDVVPSRVALGAWGTWTIAAATIPLFGMAPPTALVLGLASLHLLLRDGAPSRATIAASGLTAGAAALFRHDMAVYVVGAGLAALIGRRLRRAGVAYLAGAAAPVVAAIGVLLATAGAAPLHEAFVTPLEIYGEGRSLPFPALLPDPRAWLRGAVSLAAYAGELWTSVFFYVPVLLLLLGAGGLIARWRARAVAAAGTLLPLVVFQALLLNEARLRSDVPHVVFAWLPASLLAARLVREFADRRWIAVAAAALGLGIAAPVVAGKTFVLRAELGSPLPVFQLERARGIVVAADASPYEAAVRYVQARVPADRTIFVGNTRHDVIVANDVMFYFLADRHSATRYHHLEPGLATTPRVQETIVSELERDRVEYVVLRDSRFDGPEMVLARRGATTLDEYLRRTFVPVARFGNYTICRRAR